MRPSLAASQRRRGTVWVQASCQVPRASSLPSTGAPTAEPRRAGRGRISQLRASVAPLLLLRKKELIVPTQSAPLLLRARQAPRPSALNDDRIPRPSGSA